MFKLTLLAFLFATLLGFVAAWPNPQYCGNHKCAQLVHGGSQCGFNRDGSERCVYACNNGYRLVTTDGTHCRKKPSGNVEPPYDHGHDGHDGGWQPPPCKDKNCGSPHRPDDDEWHHWPGHDGGGNWNGKCSGNTCAHLVHGYSSCQKAPDGTERCGYVCDDGYKLYATGHSNHCRPKGQW